jgi:amino acid permease
MILGDTFQGLISALLGYNLAKPVVLLGLTTLILLPLCLLKNLSSLAPFSLLGSLGMMYTAIAMTIRYLGKAYTVTGQFGTDLPASLRPAFGSIGASGVLNPKSAILIVQCA